MHVIQACSQKLLLGGSFGQNDENVDLYETFFTKLWTK